MQYIKTEQLTFSFGMYPAGCAVDVQRTSIENLREACTHLYSNTH